jgi:hypothetical protein
VTERERVIAICSDLPVWGWPRDQWFINGSGSMIMHGITAEERGKPMGDLDIFVATHRWFQLYSETSQRQLVDGSWSREPRWDLHTTDPKDRLRRCDPPFLRRNLAGLDVDVFQSWRVRQVGDFDVAFYMANSVVIDDVPCVPLQFILDWKSEVGRAKDQVDIEVLKRHFGATA